MSTESLSPEFAALQARYQAAMDASNNAIDAAEERLGIGKYTQCEDWRAKFDAFNAAEQKIIDFEASAIPDIIAKLEVASSMYVNAELPPFVQSALSDLRRIAGG